MWLYFPSCCFEWCSTEAEAEELLMREVAAGFLSLELSTTIGSALGSISASIMEILRMSEDTEGLSLGWLAPVLVSGSTLLVASPLLLVLGGDM